MAAYPTDEEIRQLVSHLSTDNFQPFYDRVAQDVSWDISEGQPLPQGQLPAPAILARLSWKKTALGGTNSMLSSPLKYKLVNVIGGGNQAWAAVELAALDAVGKNGMQYPQKYCWVMRFNEQGLISEVRVYTDTQLSQRLFEVSAENNMVVMIENKVMPGFPSSNLRVLNRPPFIPANGPVFGSIDPRIFVIRRHKTVLTKGPFFPIT